MKYDKYMDSQCVPLCDALNSIPGIQTFESCCGHDKDSFRIWFSLRNKRKSKFLTVIGRVFDRRYGGITGWSCFLDNTDNPKLCPAFFITSGSIKGKIAYKNSKEIAKNIYHHLNHSAFCQMFLKT